jgi:2',3'-cyclic-nucleotide 2'-phosphodiesterase (5'-nucleotidase family)
MKRLVAFIVLIPVLFSCKTGMTWEKVAMDSHRTGVTAPSADNIDEALGVVDSTGKYTAPNGKVFTDGATPKVAAALINAQPAMAEVKEVIAYSTRAMVAEVPESELSNFVVDFIRSETEKIVKRKVDVAVTNIGGIRVDMPQGDVILDDIRSMFPFNNKLCYVELPGSALVKLMDDIATYGPQCVSGVKMVIADKKVESLEVGGKPVDPKKKYGVATVDFLLDGGDNISVARGASKLIITDVIIGKAIEQYVRNLTAEGVLLEHQDGFARPAGINSGGQARRAGSDDNDVVHILPP